MKNRLPALILMLIACIGSVSVSAGEDRTKPKVLTPKPLPIVNDAPRFDTDGNEIRCQGGSMMKLGDTWHWYGIDIEASKKNDSPIYHAVRCYTSKDLSRWKFEREVFTKHVPNRVDVVYNPRTRKYVLFTKEMNPAMTRGEKIEDGGTGVALCDTPTGDFVWKGRIKLPDSVGGGDQSVFIDDDGKAYITYAVWRTRQEANVGMMIAELSDDYTQFTTLGVGRNVMTPWGIGPKDATETLVWQQSWWLDAAKGTWSKRKEQNP